MSQINFVGVDVNKDEDNDDNDDVDEDLDLQWGFEIWGQGFEIWDCIDDQALGFWDLVCKLGMRIRMGI